MRKYYAAALIALTLLFAGCLKQDYSDCGLENNCVLMFELRDGNGTSLFAEKIHSIDAVVFDANQCYVAHARVTKDALNQFPGIRFSVEPGEYRVVCWGNVSQNTSMIGITEKFNFDQCYLETVSNTTGCPLYYAPQKDASDRPDPIVTRADNFVPDYNLYSITVPPGQVTTKEIEFSRAHRNVNVYLKNYDSSVESGDPTILLTNIPMRSDFFLRTGPSRKTYSSKALRTETKEGFMKATGFNAPITPFADDMYIHVIRASDGQVQTTVNLSQYVRDNQDKIEDINEFGVLLTYGLNGAVTITVPGWSGEPIVPEW